MPKFADALESVIETPEANDTTDDTSTVDTAETTDDTASNDGSAAAHDGKTDADAKEGEQDDEKPAEDAEESGSWFAPKKAPTKPAGKDLQKKMPDSVRSRIEAETRQKVESEYSWAVGIGTEEGHALRTLNDLGKQNPIALVDRFVTALYGNPVYQKQLLDYFDSVGLVPKGSASLAPVQGDEDPMPKLVVDTPQGASEAAIAKWQSDMAQWQQRQVLKEVDKRLAPVLGDRDRSAQHAEQERRRDAFKENIRRTIASRQGFEENKAEILKTYNALPRAWASLPADQQQLHPEFVSEPQLLLDAYHTVMQQKAIEADRKRVAADLKKKEDVNVVNPQAGGQVGTKKKGFSSKNPFLDALKQESSKPK